ncbi:MAG: epoxyqueuosine reductase QueH [Thermoplasmatota archaeon]
MKGNILLHTCCGPCLTSSRMPFEEEELEITAFWFNPNIHPSTEHEKRLQTLERYLYLYPMGFINPEEYPLHDFLEGQICAAREDGENASHPSRCRFCYFRRLKRTAQEAKERGFDHFSTTLLLSKYQLHDIIRKTGEEVAEEIGVDFVYKDLRKNWRDSINISRELRLYRQPYCGCIFSEMERYAGRRTTSGKEQHPQPWEEK